MARKHRDMNPGIFHVYTHCVWAARALYRDDVDRTAFVRELARTTVESGWTLIGYCLMRSHYHLLVDVQQGVLPKAMQMLNFRYAGMFNVRWTMRGHVFGARYDSRRINDTDHLLTTFKYVMRNPVEADLCDAPHEWPWSSYAATVGLAEPIPWVDPAIVLNCMDAADLDTAIARLRRHVEGP